MLEAEIKVATRDVIAVRRLALRCIWIFLALLVDGGDIGHGRILLARTTNEFVIHNGEYIGSQLNILLTEQPKVKMTRLYVNVDGSSYNAHLIDGGYSKRLLAGTSIVSCSISLVIGLTTQPY